MKKRILNTIGKAFDPKAKEILDKVGKVDYEIPSQKQLLKIIGDYDYVLCGLGLNFDKEVLSKAKKLKAIATATTGLDHIDMKFAEEKGIKILSLRGENEFLDTITGTAELALGLMITLVRNMHIAYPAVLNGEWDREKFKGHSLYGQTLGIVGLGRLGKMMARYGKALGKRVIFYDPKIDHNHTFDYKKVDFDELLKESDYISIHVHLTPETEYMFNKDSISKMKPSAYIINTSRGKIVHEKDIIDAIKKKKIAGYATDVLDGELVFINNDCSEHIIVKHAKTNPNILIVPHIGGMTHESRRDTDVFIAKKLSNMI
jgi:D-3-phosphoglycerate dehydrogenase